MIVLDATTKSLEVVLGGATATPLPFVASYIDLIPCAPGEHDGQTTGTTAVTLVPAPSADVRRQVNSLQVHNADSAAATVTIRYKNTATSTTRIIVKVALAAGAQLTYTDADGWRVMDADGQILTAGAATVTPGGIDKEVQFNDSGVFGGDDGLTYDKATEALTVGGPLACAALTATGDVDLAGFDLAASDGTASFTSTVPGAWNFTSSATEGGRIAVVRAGTVRAAIGTAESLEGGSGNNNGGVWAGAWPTTGSAANAVINDSLVMKRSTSSRRYKTDIEPLKAGLTEILALRPIAFTGKTDRAGSLGKWKHFGFLAEDMDEVMPNLVGYEKVDGECLPGWIEYDYLTAPIVKAIQELHERLETATRTIADLTARIHELEAEPANLTGSRA